jgi:hypothetical protein
MRRANTSGCPFGSSTLIHLILLKYPNFNLKLKALLTILKELVSENRRVVSIIWPHLNGPVLYPCSHKHLGDLLLHDGDTGILGLG